jgi:hypothetical protein
MLGIAATLKRSRLGAVMFAVALLAASSAHADHVTVKGTTLRGKIVAVSASCVTLETEYGKGAITIDWKDVEDLATDADFEVLYGDGRRVDAPLRGLSDGSLLVGTEETGVTTVALTELFSGAPIGPGAPGWRDRMRDYWRYWDGSVDAAVNVQKATTDTVGFLVGFGTTRTKDPTHLIVGANYRYSTQKEKGQDKSTIEDRAYGLIRGEYKLTSRLFSFASGDATYDAIQHLSIRAVPKLGLGYLIWEEKLDETRRDFLSVEAGPAWVYEAYFGPDDNDYFAAALGAAGGYHLPYGAHIGWRLDYLPAIDDFQNDYLLRNELGLTLPLLDPLAAKLSLIDEYDSTPAEDSDHNSLYFASGLSVLW